MILTLADANRVITGAIEKADQLGAKMNIAVCDAGGRLLAFQRMDGAMWAGSFGSQGKAMASAAFGRPSGDLTPRADHPTLRGIAAALAVGLHKKTRIAPAPGLKSYRPPTRETN
jgi:glc operon protein GlcG